MTDGLRRQGASAKLPPVTQKHGLGILALALLTACGPRDMKPEEVNSVLFPAEGVIAGYDFSASWTDIKAKHNEVFEVRDDPDFKQLRRKISDNAGSDGYFIGFQLDDAGNVESFDVSINGSEQNTLTVRRLLDDVIAHYDKTIGRGSCGPIPDSEGNSSTCDWSAPGKPSVHVSYYDFSDMKSGSVNIEIKAPK